MAKYVDLMKAPTNYCRKMTQLKNRIFGDVVRPTNKPSLKVIALMSERPVKKNPEKTVDYYPRHVETNKLIGHLRNYGLFRDEHQDFKEEMMRIRELRGKRIWGKENNKKSQDNAIGK